MSDSLSSGIAKVCGYILLVDRVKLKATGHVRCKTITGLASHLILVTRENHRICFLFRDAHGGIDAQGSLVDSTGMPVALE